MQRSRNKKVDHIHKYFRNRFGAWECSGYDDCPHVIPTNVTRGALGRLSLCWGCESPMKLDQWNMVNDHPLCSDCNIKSQLDEIREDYTEYVKFEQEPLSFKEYLISRSLHKLAAILTDPQDEVRPMPKPPVETVKFTGKDVIKVIEPEPEEVEPEHESVTRTLMPKPIVSRPKPAPKEKEVLTEPPAEGEYTEDVDEEGNVTYRRK